MRPALGSRIIARVARIPPEANASVNTSRQERSDLASSRCSFQRLARNLPETVGFLIKSTVMRVRFPLPTESDHD
jgi:hypothetical protein